MEITAKNNKSENSLPLLKLQTEAAKIAYYQGRMVTYGEFLSHVYQVSKILPKHKYSINLCDDRYHFLVMFTACVVSGQISLMPSSRAEKEIASLQISYEDSYLVDDQMIVGLCQSHNITGSKLDAEYTINADQDVAILFTSGSTGLPKANLKTWRQLFESAKYVRNRLGISETEQHSIIATVPPQHMFGFETTIIYAMLSGIVIHSGRPFYPLDIQAAISEMPKPRVLVTTPIHLKTCTTLKDSWSQIDFVLSATAMMPVEVAEDAERVMKCEVKEIYGCSEAGVVATRRTTTDRDWKLIDNYILKTVNSEIRLRVPAYPEDIVLPDILNIKDNQRFTLTGRNTDLIKIGGKRASLSDITLKLKGLPGIEDAICVMPEDDQRKRLVALVVAPQREIPELRKDLSQFIDSVFLPRPFIKVEKLPYNELGKLRREDIMNLIKTLQKNNSKNDV